MYETFIHTQLLTIAHILQITLNLGEYKSNFELHAKSILLHDIQQIICKVLHCLSYILRLRVRLICQ